MATYSDIYNLGMVPQGSRVVMVVSKGASSTQLPQPIPVDNVMGKTQGAALEHMTRRGIKPTVIYDYHRTARKGTVIAQYPSAETNLTSGNEAAIIVSSGEALQEKPAVALPDLLGRDEVEALAMLEAAGLAPQVMYAFSSEYPEGTVAAQLPDRTTYASGTAKKNTISWVMIALLAIVLLVGGYFLSLTAGKAIQARRTEIAVPNVVGMKLEDASKSLIDKKLKVGTVTKRETDDESLIGKVLSSDPAAGKKAKPGSAVNLIIANNKAGSEEVEVPALGGMSRADAEKLLKEKGFAVEVVKEPSSDVAVGTVLEQSPAAGMKLPKGSTVSIIVAASEKPTEVEVPNVVGLTTNAASTSLSSAGLTVTSSKSFSETVAKGLVISQNPAAGSKVEEGSSVALVISDGKEVTTVVVPNVVGKTLDEAINILGGAGFDVTTDGAGTQDGTSIVAAQTPSAGTAAKAGSTVTLTLSTKP